MRKKVKCIKQIDPKECGPVCMAMISDYYGFRVSVSKLREYGGTDLQGTNIKGIIKIGEYLGLDVKGVRAETPTALFKIELPAIAHIITTEGMTHFIIIEKIKNNKIYIVDPAKGKKKEKLEDFVKYWTGILLLIKRNQNFKKGDESIKFLPMIFRLLRPNKWLILGIFIASLFLNLCGFVSTFYFKFLVDEIVPNGLIKSLHIISIGILLIYIIQNILSFARSQLTLYLGMRTDKALMVGYYNHVLSLPINFFETRKTGEIISRFMDANKIRDAVASAVVIALMDVVMLIAGSIILYLVNVTLFLITLLAVPIYILLAYSFQKKYNKYNEEQMEENAKLNSYVVESVRGISTIRSYTGEREVFIKVEHYFIEVLKKVFKLGKYTNIQSAIKGFLDLAISLFILWMGSQFVIEGAMTLGELLTFNALVIYFLGPIERIIELQPKLQSANIAAKRLGEILDLKAEDDSQYGNPINTTILDDYSQQQQYWDIKNVSFGYGNRGKVLKNLNFKIYPKEHIAFVGESGSGKSTIAKLLVSYYQPDEGEIIVNGSKLENINKRYLRSKISYVTQNSFFFSASIRENLLYGIEFIPSEEKIIGACKNAEIHDFIEGLPRKYDTILEENGGNLSGGQLQRLAIAKALLKQPYLLILDEATSALDSTTEQKIIKNLRKLQLKKDNGVEEKPMIITIAHRLSTIKHADNIIVLKEGEIIEAGSHDNLLKNKNEYYELWKNQEV
ncbi:peptidase domain-containing ABC transporter [Gemella haemolysans]|uniref:Peptidase domain-containing ABC transporter n=1 Tax=Gemella haemolysans TaxID=1379 RepID=A0AAW6B350_9BACL|nr:peptidase domain-containing ABC transporter [Gemella haemolysans]MDB6185860.1 peptidase domain-containing ABC transporter [Gemella haemolysans]MDU4714333.1 peptidase domain-containing ABC transporter [Gemella haemolysans]